MIQEFLTWGRRFEERDFRGMSGDWTSDDRSGAPHSIISRAGSQIEISSHSAPLAAGDKKRMSSCQAPSCLTAISTEVEKSPHSILLAESDKKHMPNCQGL